MVDVSDIRNPTNRRGRLSIDRRRCLLTDTSTLNKTCYKTKNVSFLSRCKGPLTSGLHPRVFDEFKPVDALSALEIPLSRRSRGIRMSLDPRVDEAPFELDSLFAVPA